MEKRAVAAYADSQPQQFAGGAKLKIFLSAPAEPGIGEKWAVREEAEFAACLF